MASVNGALGGSPEGEGDPDVNSREPEDDEAPYPCPIGKRVYHDERSSVEKQTPMEHAIAVLTLALYTAWPYILLMLVLLSFIPPIFVLNICIFSTLLLPCPLCWEQFLKWDLFRLWRQYFSFSYYMEEVRGQHSFSGCGEVSVGRNCHQRGSIYLRNFRMALFRWGHS